MKLLGVNLGGWLLLERWITPSLFAGLAASDEYSFCEETAHTGYGQLKRHRDTFMTKADFAWLAQHKINAVRIPVGYWALRDDPPYINCEEQLDKAFVWAKEFGLRVIIDLHGAPGSQNGNDHSGKAGNIDWVNDDNIQRTLDAIGGLAKRYGRKKSLWGIELLNEPGWDVPLVTLRDFYKQGYKIVRENCTDDVAVIISDAFRPLGWNNFMNEPGHKNVVLDMHLYQLFSPADKALDLQGHLDKVQKEWANDIMQSDKPVIIGEWSLGLDPKTFAGMNQAQKRQAQKAYAVAQLAAFGHASGWFFWNYKTENMPDWNYRHLADTDVL